MAQSKYIKSVQDAAKGRPKSTAWYQDKIKEFGKPGAQDLLRDGKLNMFFYNPKHKKTLPYYDTFPLVLPLESYSDGFLGINFHYLPVGLRMRLLDRLVDFSNNVKFDESTKLIVNYKKVQKINLIRPTIHKYLKGYTMSQFRRIDADEFTIATLLPVQRFKKASDKEVWKESRGMI